MSEVKLEWRQYGPRSWNLLRNGQIAGIIQEWKSDEWRIHPRSIAEVHLDADSAKVAVVTELLRRNDAERLALQALK